MKYVGCDCTKLPILHRCTCHHFSLFCFDLLRSIVFSFINNPLLKTDLQQMITLILSNFFRSFFGIELLSPFQFFFVFSRNVVSTKMIDNLKRYLNTHKRRKLYSFYFFYYFFYIQYLNSNDYLSKNYLSYYSFDLFLKHNLSVKRSV